MDQSLQADNNNEVFPIALAWSFFFVIHNKKEARHDNKDCAKSCFRPALCHERRGPHDSDDVLQLTFVSSQGCCLPLLKANLVDLEGNGINVIKVAGRNQVYLRNQRLLRGYREKPVIRPCIFFLFRA